MKTIFKLVLTTLALVVNPVSSTVKTVTLFQRLPTIIDVVQANPGLFSTLLSALSSTGFTATLSCDTFACQTAAYTVFAPSNAVFDSLTGTTLGRILVDPNFLRHLEYVLLYHVVPGRRPSFLLGRGVQLQTLQGDAVETSRSVKTIFVNDASIFLPDVQASNGIIHGIDGLLLPPFMQTTVAGVVASTPQLSSLLGAVTAAGLTTPLGDETQAFTLFAPTNSALAALGNIVATTPSATLTSLLQYHLLMGSIVFSDQLVSGPLVTRNGIPISVSFVGPTPFLNGIVRFVTTDILASNGVVHIIDTVLLPPVIPNPVPLPLPQPPLPQPPLPQPPLPQPPLPQPPLPQAPLPQPPLPQPPLPQPPLPQPPLPQPPLPQPPLPQPPLPQPPLPQPPLPQPPLPQAPLPQAPLPQAPLPQPPLPQPPLPQPPLPQAPLPQAPLPQPPLPSPPLPPPPFTPLPPDLPSVFDIASATPILSTLVSALTATGLAESIDTEGPLTFFAPTNDAFSSLGIDLSTADPDTLIDILTYHILPGVQVASSDLFTGPVIAFNGDPINVRVTPNPSGPNFVTLNGKTNVVAFDNFGANGVLHIIDQVLIPPLDLIERASSKTTLSTLVSFISTAGLVDTFQASGPYTVLAPTNLAFRNLQITQPRLYSAITSDLSVLAQVLNYHVIAGQRILAQLTPGPVVTIQGEPITIVRPRPGGLRPVAGPRGIFITSGAKRRARVTTANIGASNGIIHIINEVLIPPSLASTIVVPPPRVVVPPGSTVVVSKPSRIGPFQLP